MVSAAREAVAVTPTRPPVPSASAANTRNTGLMRSIEPPPRCTGWAAGLVVPFPVMCPVTLSIKTATLSEILWWAAAPLGGGAQPFREAGRGRGRVSRLGDRADHHHPGGPGRQHVVKLGQADPADREPRPGLAVISRGGDPPYPPGRVRWRSKDIGHAKRRRVRQQRQPRPLPPRLGRRRLA